MQSQLNLTLQNTIYTWFIDLDHSPQPQHSVLKGLDFIEFVRRMETAFSTVDLRRRIKS